MAHPPNPMRYPETEDPQRRAEELVRLIEQEITLLRRSMDSHDPAVSRLTSYLDELKELMEATSLGKSEGKLRTELAEVSTRVITQIALALLERWM
jgi:hypothetical protein